MTLTLTDALAEMPLVAILRGVRHDEVAEIAEVIVNAGIRIIEVPLNSPEPFASITTLCKTLKDRALIGAGTVLTTADVDQVAASGGTVIVSPNCNLEVIRHTKKLGMLSLPGFFTPTEAFAAVSYTHLTLPTNREV